MGAGRDERRRWQRIYVRALGPARACRVELAGAAYPMQLLDISRGGARLRTIPGDCEDALTVGNTVRCELTCDERRVRLAPLTATVRRLECEQLGLEFEAPLDVSATDLQRLVS